MRLPCEFVRLPVRFDAERLRAEVAGLGADVWRPHPQGHAGNDALPLIAVAGDPEDDGVVGPMLPTPHLGRLEYLGQVLERFGSVLGRTRLMRIEGGASATRHVDTNHYWSERVRIHVPVVTDPRIRFQCAEHEVFMGPGEAWIFDAWLPHDVLNPTGNERIHLVADTTGSPAFWSMVAAGERFGSAPCAGAAPEPVAHVPGRAPALETERVGASVVMTPWEQTIRRVELLDELAPGADPDVAAQLRDVLAELGLAWRQTWARHGDTEPGWPDYDRLVEVAQARLDPLAGQLPLRNGTDGVAIARQRLLRPARVPAARRGPDTGARSAARTPHVVAARTPAAGRVPPVSRPLRGAAGAARFDRPLFVVGAPRSGTSMVFEALARCPDAWTIGGESHAVIESVRGLSPADRGWDSNRLEALDASPARVAALTAGFLAALRDPAGATPPPGATGVRLVEKTPRNALRVPFLAAAYPDALFLHVHRDPEPTVASMLEAWRSGRFVTYPGLPGWTGPPWSLLLTPGWRTLAAGTLEQVVTTQWHVAVRTLLDDLDRLDPGRVLGVDATRFAADPGAALTRVCGFAGLTLPADAAAPLPLSAHTLTPPHPDKWRAHEAVLAPLMGALAPTADRARRRLQASSRPVSRPGAPLASVATTSVAELLTELGASLLASTYQAGKLILLRASDGSLNTHFRDLERPMGLAVDTGDRLAVGTAWGLLEYRDTPAVAARLDDRLGTHDACFLPRRSHLTGDVRIHDVAYAGDQPWFVATAFSCLATLDGAHSLVPQWRPPFISALAAEDRCHLNGMAVVDDRVRFVTALGADDRPSGWRDRRADGGVLLDVDSCETVLSGLSMPHSPRWHDGRLWVLESGRGALLVVDPAKGSAETVTTLPGFTRGLAFAGRFAFIGLSQVREATVFGGIPLTAGGDALRCGIWVVDLHTGAVAGFVEFQDAVQEVFDVTVLARRFPEIAERDADVTMQSFVLPPASVPS